MPHHSGISRLLWHSAKLKSTAPSTLPRFSVAANSVIMVLIRSRLPARCGHPSVRWPDGTLLYNKLSLQSITITMVDARQALSFYYPQPCIDVPWFLFLPHSIICFTHECRRSEVLYNHQGPPHEGGGERGRPQGFHQVRYGNYPGNSWLPSTRKVTGGAKFRASDSVDDKRLTNLTTNQRETMRNGIRSTTN